MQTRSSLLASVCAVALLSGASAVGASAGTGGPSWLYPHPLPFHGAHPRHTAAQRAASSAYWTPVSAASPFGSNGAGTAVLMTDGTVLISDNTNNWYKLTPDLTGSYINGSWSQVASMSSGYGPLYFADSVLPDGRLLIEGGEYNFFKDAETNQGAIYDPVANAWTSVSPPSGWSSIGDAQSIVLADDTLMLGNCCYKSQALFDATNLSWTLTGTGKADTNSEEGWSMLPNGNVLTADVGLPTESEVYNPATGSWSSAGTLINLVQSYEIGPQVLRPDGTVFVAGANGASAVYDSNTGSWSAGPRFPRGRKGQLDIADGAAALLPDGDVLMVASPGVYNIGAQFMIYTGSRLPAPIPGTPNAPEDSSYYFRFLVLPTGQVLVTDGSDDVEIFTKGGAPNPSWAPQITAVPTVLTHGNTYTVTGTYLNGLSQAGAYGDDAQASTNYPLVVITNAATGHVFFARTHGFSTMQVANPNPASASFDVPANIETGAGTLQVVTNGIPSLAAQVTVY